MVKNSQSSQGQNPKWRISELVVYSQVAGFSMLQSHDIQITDRFKNQSLSSTTNSKYINIEEHFWEHRLTEYKEEALQSIFNQI